MLLKLDHMFKLGPLKFSQMVFCFFGPMVKFSFFGPLDLDFRPSSNTTYYNMCNTFVLVKNEDLDSSGLIFNKICFGLVS